jgi:predicted RNase H-like HicB family nuclease
MKYAVYLEKDISSDYGVTVPDLPGCFSAGSSIEEAFENAEEAILTHIEGMMLDNENIPQSRKIDELKKINPNPDYIWGFISVDIGKLSKEIKRINITIPENILSKIDAFAQKEGESRSGFLASAAIEYIAQHSEIRKFV